MRTRLYRMTAGSVCALVLAAAAAPCVRAQSMPNLTPESVVKLELVDRIGSGISRKGDRVNLRAAEDVVERTGAVLIRKGTAAFGTVAQVRRAGSFGKRGLLDVTLDYTTAVDGQRVPLRANMGKHGSSNSGAAIATFALVTPLGFFVKGSNTTVEPGTVVLASVDASLTINPGGASGAPTVLPAPPALPGAGAGVITAGSTVLLRNGDRITGHIASLSEGVFTIVTANGSLRIAAADIREITTLAADAAAAAPAARGKTRR